MTGCSTPQRSSESRPKDWEAEDAAMARVIVPAAPVIEPAPPAPPVPVGSPKATSAHEPAETWVALNRWCRNHGLAVPALLTMSPLPTFALKTASGSLILRMGSRIAYWEGMDLRLGYAPHLVDA